ncbi:hypothetical protein C4578_03760 [Candidatus Microgenomates bacterium]|jgi:hypothetical protein|nr:MAG: hypothetical protein C4578_03760 [Candidatus Microgenomates bacterium]
MKKNLIFIFTIFLVMIFGAFYFSKMAANFIDTKEKPSTLLTPTAALTPTPYPDPLGENFSKTGVLTNFDSKKEKKGDSWALVYEEQGKPALKVELSFSPESVCSLSQEDLKCSAVELPNGLRVKVEGVLTDKTSEPYVLVTRLSAFASDN